MRRACAVILSVGLAWQLVNAAGPDLTVIDSAVETLNYHLRLAPARHTDAEAILYWDYADSLNHCALHFSIPAIVSADDILGTSAPYSIHTIADGRDSTITAGRVNIAYRPAGTEGLSAVLRVFAGKAYIDLGSAKAEITEPVPFSNIPGRAMGYECSRTLTELRNHIRLTPGEAVAYADFDSVEALTAYIADSKDPIEGLWTYLDRDIDLRRADLGGFYRLATIRRPDGDYDIVYLSGAGSRKTDWQPLRIKGRLHPTIFRDHFDLVWHTPTGTTLRYDTSATIEVDGNVLRLSFPLWNAAVRFSRVFPAGK